VAKEALQEITIGPNWDWAQRVVDEQVITGELEKCDDDIFTRGGAMFGYSSSKYVCEAYARYLAGVGGGNVDWHYMGGRPVYRWCEEMDGKIQALANELPLVVFEAYFRGRRGTLDGRSG
jgi:hypothetical protein